ncbi:MAG: hypothetical protein AAF927_22890 [Bacteroidota bacterium]
MKLKSLRYSLMAIGLLLAVACQPEIVRPETEEASSQKTTDLCQHFATVLANDCGLYLALENDEKIFVRNTREVELQEGMKLKVGYSIVGEGSHNSSSGSCRDGVCDTPSGDQADELKICMQTNGIQEARVSCIAELSSSSSTD